MTQQIGNGSIPLRIGRLIDATVYGGPYKQVPELFWGVKMAEEIDHPHMVDVPTKDYCVPKVSDLKAGIVKSLMAMINEEDVYVGCWGGIGRTGIFLAALAKVQIEYRKTKHRAGRGEDPVLYVRKHFIPHAVETAEQEQYIADLDVSDIVQWLSMTQVAMGMGGLTPARNENTGRIAPIYEAHEEIPPDFLEHATDLQHDTHKAAWKEAYSHGARNGFLEQEDEGLDTGDTNALSTQMLLLEESVAHLRLQVDAQQHTIKVLNDRTSNQSQLLRNMEIRQDRVLTKPTMYERIRTWIATH